MPYSMAKSSTTCRGPSSVDTPMTWRWSGYRCCSLIRSGISALQGPHQVAQKFTSVTLPRRFLRGEGPAVEILHGDRQHRRRIGDELNRRRPRILGKHRRRRIGPAPAARVTARGRADRQYQHRRERPHATRHALSPDRNGPNADHCSVNLTTGASGGCVLRNNCHVQSHRGWQLDHDGQEEPHRTRHLHEVHHARPAQGRVGRDDANPRGGELHQGPHHRARQHGPPGHGQAGRLHPRVQAEHPDRPDRSQGQQPRHRRRHAAGAGLRRNAEHSVRVLVQRRRLRLPRPNGCERRKGNHPRP